MIWFCCRRIESNWRILKAIAEKYGLEFDRVHKYYIGNAYKNNKGVFLSTFERSMELKGISYELKYFDGCFNPFLVRKYANR